MSRTLIISSVLIFALSALLWLVLIATAMSMNGSDMAGRGMAQGFATITVIVLWLLLGVLLLIAGADGRLSAPVKTMMFILLPLSGVAAFMAINLLSSASAHGFQWPILVPVVAPLTIMLLAAWALIPALRNTLSPQVAASVAAVVLLALTAAPWPAVVQRSNHNAESGARNAAAYTAAREQEQQQARATRQARFDKLTQTSPLWEWMDFLDADSATDGDSTLRVAAIAGIATLPSRQTDAEQMFAKDVNTAMYHMPVLALTASPAICEGAAKFLRAAAAKFEPPTQGEVGRTLEYHRVDLYLPSLKWLVDNNCKLDSEISAIEAGIAAYATSTERDQYLSALKSMKR